MVLNDPSDVEGLPESILKAAEYHVPVDQAKLDGGNDSLNSSSLSRPGPWILTLESESIDIISKWTLLKNLKSRPVREAMYHAYAKRASRGRYDNRPVVSELLKVRQKSARNAGFPNFAEWMMQSQMLGSIAVVDSLLANMSA